MNVRAIANGLTRGINPNLAAKARLYTGEIVAPSGKREPTYAKAVTVDLQVQALTKREIEHLDNLNLSNADRAVYANRQLTGVDRVARSGGDLLDFEGATWLVVAVLEGWTTAGWCKVAVSRQRATTGGTTCGA